jgi:hypothetical protein
LCDSTGGRFYDGITTSQSAIDIALRLQEESQGAQPCTFEWESSARCNDGNVNLEISYNKIKASLRYLPHPTSVARLEFSPSTVFFSNPPAGVPIDTSITVSALNAGFNVTDVISSNPEFEINPKSFTIEAGRSIQIKLRFTPIDSNYSFATFSLENELCTQFYYASAGFKGISSSTSTLKLTHPNGGEIFVAGSDTTVTWEGIMPTDSARLEFSRDNGASWDLLDYKAEGLNTPGIIFRNRQPTNALSGSQQIMTVTLFLMSNGRNAWAEQISTRQILLKKQSTGAL